MRAAAFRQLHARCTAAAQRRPGARNPALRLARAPRLPSCLSLPSAARPSPLRLCIPRSYTARTVDFSFSNWTAVLRYQPARDTPLRWTASYNSFAVDLPAPGLW